MSKAKRQEDSSRKDSSASCHVRYEYSFVGKALEDIFEDNNYLIREDMGLDFLSPLEKKLYHTSENLFTQHLEQGVKDLLYLHCRGFEQNQEYPRVLIVDAALYLLKKTSLKDFIENIETAVKNNAEAWGEYALAESVTWQTYRPQINRFIKKWIGVVPKCLVSFSASLGLFSSRGFSLRKAKKDAELLKRYNPEAEASIKKQAEKPFELTRAKEVGIDSALVFEINNWIRISNGEKELSPAAFLKGKRPYETNILQYYRRIAPRFYNNEDGLIKHCLRPESEPRKKAKHLFAESKKDKASLEALISHPLPPVFEEVLDKIRRLS